MPQSFGKYQHITKNSSMESLSISFPPNFIPLKERWRSSGLSANFLGDYVTCFFPKDDSEEISRRSEIKGAVTYIANELIENAMKYTNPLSKLNITLVLYLTNNELVFESCNAITLDQNDSYQNFIFLLDSSDPLELYLQRQENNIAELNSGLGYLRMMNDYQATLAWNFDRISHLRLKVDTQVVIPI